jgi:Transglutaminase-like superfamily
VRVGQRALRALRAGWWTARATRAAGSDLGRHALAPVAIPAVPPSLAAGGRRVVEAVLRLQRASCLERAVVLQAWHLAHGRARDVVIGVRCSAGFEAHAWLDGESGGTGYAELLRRPPTALVVRSRPGIRGSRRSRRRRSAESPESLSGAA